ncbi:MAG TPA: LPXTG cell wall anchor domain-containing protein, partial [Candidatus Nitrosotalea sp.]|nr:LPXTG cell wall anchor domain-containing protein [Candidatus Nitrosotalea sp.]
NKNGTVQITGGQSDQGGSDNAGVTGSGSSGVNGSGLGVSSDNTPVYILIGGIIAAGIAGIIIVKKTRKPEVKKP